MFKMHLYQNQLVIDTPPEWTKYDQLENGQAMSNLEKIYLFLSVTRHRVDRIAYHVGKRMLDIVISAIGLICFLPLLALIALVIKLESPGPVFFRQVRIGQNRRRSQPGRLGGNERRREDLKGKPFSIYKFRSMRVNAASYAVKPNTKSDPRLTRVGKILRATCLDELPQLINVLKGDMSLIGPRPEMPFIVQDYSPLQSRRLAVKPGLTGLWQIYGPRDEAIHKNMQFDLYYIRNQSLVLDLKIILKTIGFMFRLENV